jgi:hypothetical protein
MQIPNPQPNLPLVVAKVLLEDGTEYQTACVGGRTIVVEDKAVEVLIICSGRGHRVERVWTKDGGIQDAQAYFQHKQLAEEVKQMKEERERLIRAEIKAKRERVSTSKYKAKVDEDSVSPEQRDDVRDRDESE